MFAFMRYSLMTDGRSVLPFGYATPKQVTVVAVISIYLL